MNIWLAQVSLGNRKSCPGCKTKLQGDNCIVSVGEYSRGCYFRCYYACRECFGYYVGGHLRAGDTLCYRPGQAPIAWVERLKDAHSTNR